MASVIRILNASIIGNGQLERIAGNVSRIFSTNVHIVNGSLNLSHALDSSRGQYNSTALLAELLNTFSFGNAKYIAIVDVDLFIPVLTFVFGEAQLNGMASVVSTHRLSNQFYGLPQDDALMLQRLEKEIIHELGHTFGLFHCHQFECVMRSSTYAEEIDLKHAELCEPCRQVLLERKSQ